jgi:hypothetical protein
VEANLLVVVSLLIGVAVVQGQNLNRMKDIYREQKKIVQNRMAKFLDTARGSEFWVSFNKDNPGHLSGPVLIKFYHWQKEKSEGLKIPQFERIGFVYQDLLAGFWIVSFGVLVVLVLLILFVLLANPNSTFWGYFLATLWWATIFSIFLGWWYLAMVALASYRREAE